MFNRFLILSETKEALDRNFRNLSGFCNNSVFVSNQILAISTSLSKYELRRLSSQIGTFIILEIEEGLKLNLENQNNLKFFIASTNPLEATDENLNKILDKISKSGIESLQSQEMALINKISHNI